MPILRRCLVVSAAAVALFLAPAAAFAAPRPTAPEPAAAAPGPPPNSMASLGDSITRGFNACGWFVDCVSRSFSTGGDGGVNSHYVRIRAKNPLVTGRNVNAARSGAKAADMPGQAGNAVAQRVQYVTMLIGANDACTRTEAAMTPVATFRGSIDTALARIRAGLPQALVYVISIPDLKRLWEIGRVSGGARNAWAVFGICQSMLANPTSTAPADEARRNRVRQRVVEFNGQLATACAAYGANCRYDGNVVFGYPFVLSQVSTWDYFHPNASGQAVLAQTSWAAGWGW